MHLTAWTYPWDIARLGADRVMGDLAAQGLQGIDLAATYHPISILSPRNNQITPFFVPRGAVFFPARSRRYATVRPAVWPDASVIGAWPAVTERLDRYDLELNSWTIMLFQPWIAQRYPQTARVYATGQPLDAGVCASSDDFREYACALVADLTDQFPVRLVKLEGVSPPAYDYGWTRRRVYFDVSPTQGELLALCFCAACTALGRDRGIDVEAVRQGVLAGAAHAEAGEYARVAIDSGIRLVREIAAVLKPGGANLSIATPVESGSGLPIEAVADHVASVMFTAIGGGDDAAFARTAAVARNHQPPIDLEMFLHPPHVVGPGSLILGIDETLGDPAWRAGLERAVALGVNRLSLYNYGLLTDTTFARLAAIARGLSSRDDR